MASPVVIMFDGVHSMVYNVFLVSMVVLRGTNIIDNKLAEYELCSQDNLKNREIVAKSGYKGSFRNFKKFIGNESHDILW